LGVLLAGFFYPPSYFCGPRARPPARPHALGLATDKGFYYLLLVIAVATLLLVYGIERSRLGRLLRGLADSPLALTTLGSSANVTRVIVFSISAFLAGLSGATFSALFGSISVDQFGYFKSIVILAVLVISGRTTLNAAVIAPLLLVVLPGYVSNGDFVILEQLGFGLLAIAAALFAQQSLGDRVVQGRVVAATALRAARPAGTTRDRAAALAVK
jgi:ABC-type branched-subunit amino acid transport system permease subunit